MGDPVLAIDGGGTKTAAVVADANGTLTYLTPSTGCNPQDGDGWRDALGSVFAQVQNIEHAVIGMPGFGEVPEHDALVADYITGQIGANHLIMNDVELAFRGAFPDGVGLLVLAGTGSMAFGGQHGDVRRAGGWGYLFGDEGSAFWIGQQALARAAAELDGRCPDTGFAPRLVTALDAPDHPFGLLDWVARRGHTRAKVAGIARIVDRLDQSGDSTARTILDAAALQLVALAYAITPLPLPWSGSGSVFKSPRITAQVTRVLGTATPPVATALTGGVLQAATLADWPITPELTARILAQVDPANTDFHRTDHDNA